MEGRVDEMAELHEHAAAQAALFNIDVEETESAEESTPVGRIGEWLVIASLPDPNSNWRLRKAGHTRRSNLGIGGWVWQKFDCKKANP